MDIALKTPPVSVTRDEHENLSTKLKKP